jgi:beta-N-acetylhexosaminidase
MLIPIPDSIKSQVADSIVTNLTLEQRVGQIFLCYSTRARLAKEIYLGGVVYMGTHIRSKEKVRKNSLNYNNESLIPLFFASDLEGGRVNRLARILEFKGFPSARNFGQWKPDSLLEWMTGKAKIIREMGINMDLAPCLDVSESGVLFLQKRSFSADTAIVMASGKVFADGLVANNILPIAKHFPGYGNLRNNSDNDIVKARFPIDTIQKYTNVFASMSNTLGGVMVSNAIYTAIDTVPASLSTKIIKLAHDIDSNWIVMPDYIEAQTFVKWFNGNTDSAAIGCFLAGNDVILSLDSRKVKGYCSTMVKFITDHPEHEAQLNTSVRRILLAKERIYPGLLQQLQLYVAKQKNHVPNF